MGHSFNSSASHASRAKQYLKPRFRFSPFGLRILFILLVALLLHESRLFSIYRDELHAKYSPTSFATIKSSAWQSDSQDPQLPHDLLAHREKWRVLGKGWEGKTYTFNNSVIKTFVPGRSPFRNCAPGHTGARWPTEIPASLAFGGVHSLSDSTTSASPNTSNTASTSGFLPVTSYFLASSNTETGEEWHLVTPLLPGGNLNNLARKLRERHPYKHFREVDAAYRPVFNRFLGTLESLHSKGFCHDDVKPSNVFVESDTNWILGDLGNIRHLSHPYHASRLWLKDNNQLLDCRANDAMRALKSYLQFIRAASNDADAFDATFFDGRETLSRLFWWASEDALMMSADELKLRSEVEGASQPPRDNGICDPPCDLRLGSFGGKRRTLRNAVESVLETKFREKGARWLAMTWIFGVPIDECQ